MKFKQLQWDNDKAYIPEMSYICATVPAPFDQIILCQDFRNKDPSWGISFPLDSYWGYYWTNLTLDKSYTLDEVKGFAQAGWEHYICTNLFAIINTCRKI